ncbi:MAG: exodeoxyribonuclease VII large subunit [Brucellaceae bacterium]|nr:exodeoxyribonuclease VII large subunit [Brucellaceae bacterium]
MSDSEAVPSNLAEYTVSEISGALRRVVEDNFGHVRIRGEISGYRGPHSSGHAYFALKDERSRIEAVIWKGVFSKLRFKPEEGMEVIATGKVTTYAGSSKYQIVIDSLEPAGAGALMALIEERKRKLEAEGLFDAARKQLLPFMPRVIGVVTSPTGAVIRDILHRIGDRFPVHVIVWPVRVQGETSGLEVAAAIEGFNALSAGGPIARPDLIIVARGGGSLEDLWGFNDEAVVRAAAASDIPLISAVGHETDWTLIDLAADVRAPTPTGAAEMAVPVKADLEAQVATLGARLQSAMRRKGEQARQNLRSAARALPSADAILAMPRRDLDELSARLPKALDASVRQMRARLDRQRLSAGVLRQSLDLSRTRLDRAAGRMNLRALAQRIADGRRNAEQMDTRRQRAFQTVVRQRRDRLEALWRITRSVSHQAVLERGYAVVFDTAGKPVRQRAAVSAGDRLSVQFADASVDVEALDDGEPKQTKPKRPKPSAPKDKPPEQGTLL